VTARPLLLWGGVALVTGYAVTWRLGRAWGSTSEERRSALPGDELVTEPHLVADHAISVDASPEHMWPWLVQVGWHRAGWYTARWVDRLLFPQNWPSSTTVRPELQDLSVGDWIPDGPPETECGFVVAELVPGRHLVLRSDSHLPLGWRQRGAWVDWTWTFVLEPQQPDRTRLRFRWRATVGPRPLPILARAALPPADLLMSRDMLRGLAERAEALRRQCEETEPIASLTA
jgi:hypothetical protein